MRIVHWLMIVVFLCTFSSINNTQIPQVTAQDDEIPDLIVALSSETDPNLLDWFMLDPQSGNKTLMFSAEKSLSSTFHPYSLVWSPDNLTVAIATCGTQEIQTLSPGSQSTPTPIFTPQSVTPVAYPPISERNSKSICRLFLSDRLGNAIEILNFDMLQSNLIWSQDGSMLAFCDVYVNDPRGFIGPIYSLYRVSVETGDIQIDRYPCYQVSWFTEWTVDNYIYFWNSHSKLYITNLNQNDLTIEVVEENIPPPTRLSPDKQWLLSTYSYGQLIQLTITNQTTGEERILTEPITIWFTKWMPDSRSLVYNLYADYGAIYQVDIEGSEPELLIETTDHIRTFSISPDGRAILYATLFGDKADDYLFHILLLDDGIELHDILNGYQEEDHWQPVIEWVPPLTD